MGPLHQFARDAAVYLTNDQILYAKKSTTGEGCILHPHPRREAYIFATYIYIYLFPPPSEYISRASHALASLVIPCILRDILEWREANGNRQMIHEDVKRDVEKRS